MTDHLTDEGVPALYWLCAEIPIILVSICLPPMLSLGRHLATNYLSPFSSKYLSFLSSRRSSSKQRSQSEDVSKGAGNPGVHLHTFSGAQDSTYAEVGSTHSMSSERRILSKTSMEDYEVHAIGGQPLPMMDTNYPGQSIRVGKTVEVSRQHR